LQPWALLHPVTHDIKICLAKILSGMSPSCKTLQIRFLWPFWRHARSTISVKPTISGLVTASCVATIKAAWNVLEPRAAKLPKDRKGIHGSNIQL
jgi:hypothetical protein